MQDLLYGVMMYGISLLTIGGIYAILSLGLNLHWGMTGLFNAGIAGFFAIGAYTSTLLTTAESPNHFGGLNLPIPVGLVASMLVAGIVAFGVGKICLRLRSDYLAIATIGVAEILRLILKNEIWLTSGSRGIPSIPRPFEHLPQPWSELGFLAVVLVLVLVLYLALERAFHSPWGRIMRAIRENETAAASTGKDVERFRMEAFVLGATLMGLGGALTAHAFKFVSPDASEPLLATFLVWVMLIIGGSGNNRGAILGAVIVWAVWSSTELLSRFLPIDWLNRMGYVRIFLVGLILQFILQRRPEGLLPERYSDE
jgi:branched-chain amino acid transport system permease protein